MKKNTNEKLFLARSFWTKGHLISKTIQGVLNSSNMWTKLTIMSIFTKQKLQDK